MDLRFIKGGKGDNPGILLLVGEGSDGIDALSNHLSACMRLNDRLLEEGVSDNWYRASEDFEVDVYSLNPKYRSKNKVVGLIRHYNSRTRRDIALHCELIPYCVFTHRIITEVQLSPEQLLALERNRKRSSGIPPRGA